MLSFIYAAYPEAERALYCFYTWHCSTQGLPFCCIARAERELLPHIFTISCFLC